MDWDWWTSQEEKEKRRSCATSVWRTEEGKEVGVQLQVYETLLTLVDVNFNADFAVMATTTENLLATHKMR